MAEAHYIDLMPHNPLGPICSAGDRTSGCRRAELRLAGGARLPYRRGPLLRHPTGSPSQPQLDGFHYIVPDGPGLGVEFNEERAQAEEFRFWEAPHLRRRDGSHTNW